MGTTSESLSFTSDGITLEGTVMRPCDATPAAAALLLSGSGPQDRDETLAGQRPFSALAAALAERGTLTFRWDDRGVGASGGDYLSISAAQLVRDVFAAMSALREAYGPLPMALAGHSQGALIAAQTAVEHPDRVSGIALLAGMALPGRELLLTQHVDVCRAEGFDEDATAATLAHKTRAFDLLTEAQSDIDAGADPVQRLEVLRSALRSLWLSGMDPETLTHERRHDIELAVTDLLEWEWRYLIGVRPAIHLSKLRCPVFAVFGGRDVQVAAAPNEAALRRALNASRSPAPAIHVLPDYNHLFQYVDHDDAFDCAALGTPFAAPVPDLLADWLDAAIALTH